MRPFFLFLISLILLTACSYESSNSLNADSINTQTQIRFNYKSLKNKWKLPLELDEISGLTYFAKNQLACVNDEEGKIYIYDLVKKKIVITIFFGKDGDYEGITYSYPNFYIIQSNGRLNIYNQEEKALTKVKLPFTSKNNIEGICLETKTTLLLALKDKGGTDGEKSDFHTIYRYDITTEKIELAYRIPNKKKIGFSGLAINPTDNKLLILSHRTKEIYQIDQTTKELDSVWQVSRKLFPQAEGICYSPNGRLFISNEREDKYTATILEF